ncbi:hypothetical protein C8N36_105129 [Pelagimonas varians]|uniref:Uncharacterized protein n=1 Tax=Pelagimonas varians TaxID=696760 RepID=A0A238K9J6_9RHOB|nr:hypothetical protein C8N36_105129 [Pelagimonas varians]SMX39580.1 hypothetical protein PEV8663_01769 [Pelagimonas varians]
MTLAAMQSAARVILYSFDGVANAGFRLRSIKLRLGVQRPKVSAKKSTFQGQIRDA